MLTAFVTIITGAMIIWLCNATPMVILARLWLHVGYKLFEIIAIHSDEETGDCYGFTFTSDKRWQEKMLKDLSAMAAKQNRSEGL
jgi:hypothetical protein